MFRRLYRFFSKCHRPDTITSISASGFDPSSIPQEIWSLVFSYLPLEDRKNVCLVCHCFDEACCSYQIQRNEQFVFYGNQNTRRAMQSLCHTERKIRNVKLSKVHLEDNTVLPFFKKCGAHIHSLILDRCVLKSGILRDILGPCKNLVCISFISTDVHTDCYLSEAIFSELEVLQKRGTFENVIDLTLELKSCKGNMLTNKKLVQFFSIFPNVRNLRLSFIVDTTESSLLSSDVSSDDVFSVSCIYHQLWRIRHQLEELSIYIRYFNPEECEDHLIFETWSGIAAIEMKNLKKLCSNSNITHITESLSHFQYLTSLSCVISRTVNMPVSAQIALILNSASKLQSLAVGVSNQNYSRMCDKCFVALIRSQLRTFSMWYTNSFHFGPYWLSGVSAGFKLSDNLMPNYNLYNLGVLTDDSTLMLLFSKYFLSLEYMCASSAREDTLYSIFNHQTKLRSLRLDHRQSPEQAPFDELRNLEITSPSQLQVNLTHLYIDDNTCLALSRFVFSKFVFSKLEALHIVMVTEGGCDIIKALWQMIQKSTQLEYLAIFQMTETTFQQWLNLFESLPKLRHFLCLDSCSKLYDDSEYRQLFNARPSLRSVRHGLVHRDAGGTPGYVSYVKDVTRNMVIMSSQSDICSDPFKRFLPTNPFP